MDLEFFAMGPAVLPMTPGSVDHQNGAHNQPRVETMTSAMLEYGTHFEMSADFHERLSEFSVHLLVAKAVVACDHGLLRHWKLQESVSILKFPWIVLLPNQYIKYVYVENLLNR